MDPMTFLIGIAIAVAALLVNVRQLGLQTRAIGLQTTAMEEERRERAAQREQRRATLLAALQAELQAIMSSAGEDYSEYRGENTSSPRMTQEGSSKAIEGQTRHQLGFAWTLLPDETIKQVISEAALLGLSPDQIGKLQTLRGHIMRVGALVSYKVGLYPALMQADIPKEGTVREFYGPYSWAQKRASHLNNALSAIMYSIAGESKAILAWTLFASGKQHAT